MYFSLWEFRVGLCFCMHYFAPFLAIILKRKRELVALLLLSYGYLVTVNIQWLFFMMQWVGLEFMIVAFSDHTNFLVLCQKKVKTLLDLLLNQKTKMPPNPYIAFAFKIF